MGRTKRTVKWNTWVDRETYGGELGSPDTITETAGYRSVTQQLARLAKAGIQNKLSRQTGLFDIETKVDEELFLSGAYDSPAYDGVSVEEGLAELQARRDAIIESRKPPANDPPDDGRTGGDNPMVPEPEPPEPEPPVEGGTE